MSKPTTDYWRFELEKLKEQAAQIASKAEYLSRTIEVLLRFYIMDIESKQKIAENPTEK